HPAVEMSNGEVSAFAPEPLFQVAVNEWVSVIVTSMVVPAATTELLEGAVRTTDGAVESMTKWNTAVRRLPAASVARTVTFTSPSAQPVESMVNGETMATGPAPML